MARSDMSVKDVKFWMNHERGQVIVLIAIGMLVMIAVVGLAIDVTLIFKAKQDLQRAIDSAALAAAYKLPDQNEATQTAYEFTRLHGYNFDPSTNPLQISFPDYIPPRKVINVSGSTDAKLAFMKIFGFQTIKVSADGIGESAPLDVYLVLDLSESMTYDTYYTQKPSKLPTCGWSYQSDCIAKWCNTNRKCDPLDIHIKPAAKFFIDQLHSDYDRVGLVAYDQYGTKIIELTHDFEAVKVEIDNLNAFDHQEAGSSTCPNTSPPGCNKQTNIGDGIMYAHNSIASEGRQDAIWSIALLTDGKANVYRNCNTCPSTPPPTPDCGASNCQTLHLCNECTEAEIWAINNAIATWKFHETVIYTIAFGVDYSQYEALMIKIADCTDDGICNNGTDNYWAAPDEAHLKSAFTEIAQRIYSRLLH